MDKKKNTTRTPIFLYMALVVVLIACLWVGWSGFDPEVPQQEVRSSIRSTIRAAIQFVVQYVAPVAILAFFAREFIGRYR